MKTNTLFAALGFERNLYNLYKVNKIIPMLSSLNTEPPKENWKEKS